METDTKDARMAVPGDRSGLEEALQRGIAAAEAGNKTTAYTIFREAAAFYPASPELWVWIGATTSDRNEAEAAFQRAQALDPDNTDARLGMRWIALRRQAEADVESRPVPTSTPAPALTRPAGPAVPVGQPASSDVQPDQAQAPSRFGSAPAALWLIVAGVVLALILLALYLFR